MIPDWEHNCVCLAELLKIRHPDLFSNLLRILTDHGVEVRILDKVRDYWLRDFCPIQVDFGHFVKFHYDPDYLRDRPDLRTGADIVNSFSDLGKCHLTPIVLDGGNVVASGTKVIVTDKIYKENPDWIRAKLRNTLQVLLQVEQLIVIPKEPFDYIGHSDAQVRFINEDTVLVNDYTNVDPAYGDRLYKVLRRNKLSLEPIQYCPEPEMVDGIPSAVGCYSNFLRTKNVIIAPIYENEVDHVALKKLESVFPGLPIIPLNCKNLAREGGVLNCVSNGLVL